jgi:hypothetical protein
LRWQDDFETICFKNLNRRLSHIDLIRIDIAAIKIGDFSTPFSRVSSKPLSKGRGLVERKISSPVDIKKGIQHPFDGMASQEAVGDMREEGSKPTEKVDLTENPIPKRPSLFIQIFCFGDEVQFRDIDTRRANHIAKVATYTEVNPLIHRWVTWPPKPLSPRTCLFWTWKKGSDPRNWTDGHTGGTTDAKIGIILGPGLFVHTSTRLVIASKNSNNQYPNSK